MPSGRAALYNLIILLSASGLLQAQEVVTGLPSNRIVWEESVKGSLLKSLAPDTLELPFLDDFSADYPLPLQTLWTDNYVFINNTYPVDQVTLGVATFDALDDAGLIYENASQYQFEADHLTSAPVNLEGLPGDNFFLSFFYQPQGIADEPEPTDSLSLQFYSPETGEWYHAWSTAGEPLHRFKPAIIQIDDPKYLRKGFRFRFINYASLSSTVNDPAMAGNADHWHIDYVYLDRGRNIADTLVPDVAFTKPLRAPLNNYESMPWKQFRASYLVEQGNWVTLNYRNNDIIVRNVTRSFTIFDLYDGVNVYSSVQGATNVQPGQDISYDAPLIYTFNTTNPDSALFLIKGILKTDDFDNKDNDTIRYIQRFNNYFSVDDGSSESGYGINGQGASSAMAVYRYRSYIKDTIRAVAICFNDSYQSANRKYFDIVILQDNNGVPGDIIYAEEEFLVDPGSDVNGFSTYWLSDPVEVEGYFFVGWRQRSETFLNAGLDLNTPHLDRQYYYLNGIWYISGVDGSLMIRPVTGKQVASGTGFDQSYLDNIVLWPNPASEQINIQFTSDRIYSQGEIMVYDTGGRQWIRCQLKESLDISTLPQGLYFLEIVSGGKREAISKFLRIK